MNQKLVAIFKIAKYALSRRLLGWLESSLLVWEEKFILEKSFIKSLPTFTI